MNVPRLRFSEFNGDWNTDKILNVCDAKKGNGLSKNDITDDGYDCILYGELYTKYNEVIRKVESHTKLNSSNFVRSKVNDVIIPASGETPIDIAKASCVMLDNVILGGDLNVLTPNNIDGRFLSYQISYKRKMELANLAQGNSVVHLYYDKFKNVKIKYPSIKEQNKIANTIELIDKKIKLQSKKIEDLKLYKKGLFQKLNNLECNREVILSDIVDFQNGKGHEGIIDEDGEFILVNSKFISTEGKVIKKCSEQLTPLFKNDIVMVMSDLPNGKALSKCFYINENNRFSLNQRICSLRVKSDDNPKYLFYKINRNPYYIKFDDGVNQTNLKKEDVLNLKLLLPEIKLQNKISSVLNTLDNKIKLENNKLEKLQGFKKGLMQNMFV